MTIYVCVELDERSDYDFEENRVDYKVIGRVIGPFSTEEAARAALPQPGHYSDWEVKEVEAP